MSPAADSSSYTPGLNHLRLAALLAWSCLCREWRQPVNSKEAPWLCLHDRSHPTLPSAHRFIRNAIEIHGILSPLENLGKHHRPLDPPSVKHAVLELHFANWWTYRRGSCQSRDPPKHLFCLNNYYERKRQPFQKRGSSPKNVLREERSYDGRAYSSIQRVLSAEGNATISVDRAQRSVRKPSVIIRHFHIIEYRYRCLATVTRVYEKKSPELLRTGQHLDGTHLLSNCTSEPGSWYYLYGPVRLCLV